MSMRPTTEELLEGAQSEVLMYTSICNAQDRKIKHLKIVLRELHEVAKQSRLYSEGHRRRVEALLNG